MNTNIPLTSYQKHLYYLSYFKHLKSLTKLEVHSFIESYVKLYLPNYEPDLLGRLFKCIKLNHQKKIATITEDILQRQQLLTLLHNNGALFLNLINFELLNRDLRPREFTIKFFNSLIPDTFLNKLSITNDQKFVKVRGVVKTISTTYSTLKYGNYLCSICKQFIGSAPNYFEIVTPVCLHHCRYSQMHLEHDLSLFIDVKKVEIQELQENLAPGEQPSLLTAIVPESLSRNIIPGKENCFTGLLLKYQPDRKKPVTIPYLEVLEVHTVMKVTKKQYKKEEIKQFQTFASTGNLVQDLADALFSTMAMHKWLKFALVLQLFGGVKLLNPDGSNAERADIHLLLIGDPGCGKSETLKIVSRFFQGVHASGVTSSGPGLTATVVKDSVIPGRWAVEVGAFVFADRGLLTIDEIDKIKQADIAAIHEAMEQQTISIAKAGILMTLNSRCAVLGAANPQFGKFVDGIPLEKQLTIPSTILNRFDLIFFLRDTTEPERDQELIQTIFNRRTNARSQNIDFFRAYIEYARTLQPVLTKAAQQKISELYLRLRKNTKLLVSARQLQALIRLAEASAKARCSLYVTLKDAELISNIVEYSLTSHEEMNVLKELNVSYTKANLFKAILEEITTLKTATYEALVKKFGNGVEDGLSMLLSKSLIYEPQHRVYEIIN